MWSTPCLHRGQPSYLNRCCRHFNVWTYVDIRCNTVHDRTFNVVPVHLPSCCHRWYHLQLWHLDHQHTVPQQDHSKTFSCKWSHHFFLPVRNMKFHMFKVMGQYAASFIIQPLLIFLVYCLRVFWSPDVVKSEIIFLFDKKKTKKTMKLVQDLMPSEYISSERNLNLTSANKIRKNTYSTMEWFWSIHNLALLVRCEFFPGFFSEEKFLVLHPRLNTGSQQTVGIFPEIRVDLKWNSRARLCWWRKGEGFWVTLAQPYNLCHHWNIPFQSCKSSKTTYSMVTNFIKW